MTVRERVSLNSLGKPLPPKTCHRAVKDIEVAQGNHELFLNGGKLPTHSAAINILHFPMRSYAQFKNKIAKGGAAYARNTELPKMIGKTWRLHYEMLRRGELESYYGTQVVDDESLRQGLAAGELVRDERLLERLSTIARPNQRKRGLA
jgi:hypothetical protein